ncbi:peptidoglycan D,D-transpeptidase FtsI family protein [Leifsonia soli]|uniref:Peptidoglycan glycosyltransferase n=1 Tax=Leifsonia soli TaxID=582665 RepID=A0A852T3L3_9MICO|nr:penicillin-binding transpeptidase domain-containing protein [Leifsonia soli]NYD75413.1 peptidoglycan glycosyltransferase [Leifsonia soli]
MNREIKRVSTIVLAMFLALLVSTSIIQAIQTDALSADARNTRARNDSYSAQRGAILVAGQPIAQSVPSNDVYKWQRVYSNGPLYSAVTGFFPINGEPTGLEGALDSKLSGSSNAQFFERVNAILTGKNPQGATVETTIDPVAQQAAWDALGDYQGAVVLLQPKTGKILAMVSKPTYDPNTLASHDGEAVQSTYDQLLAAPGDPLINRTIGGDLNPPGSTFKPVMSASAFGTGQYTKDSQLPNPASLQLPESPTIVKNDSLTTCGPGATVSIATAQILSCNIPFAELGMQLKPEVIKAQADKFGFNQSFDIPIPVEKSVYPLYPVAAERALGSFGQKDDRATPLQMAMVSAAIANGGTLMTPNLVDSIRSPDLQTLESFQPKEFSRPLSRQNADTIKQMMVDGVDHGVAGNARIGGVQVGGKTGTAQNGDNDPYSLWFTGFAPANDPEFAVAVVVENGGGKGQSGTGNSIAAPIARKVLEAVLNK